MEVFKDDQGMMVMEGGNADGRMQDEMRDRIGMCSDITSGRDAGNRADYTNPRMRRRSMRSRTAVTAVMG